VEVEKIRENRKMVDRTLDGSEKQSRETKEDQTRTSAGLAARQNAKVLIVDDEEGVRSLLSQFLTFMGFEVTAACNGSEGLSLFLNNPFHLVITDLMMPGIDGWALASHIKERSPRTPVILITGQQEEIAMEKVSESCVDIAISKPFKIRELTKTVQEILGEKTYA
jgi:DNA-binding response OmpR family regulator